MSQLKIYGASDDLVEIEGQICEEFNPEHDDEPSYLAFSDGTVLSIIYNNEGFWRITPIFVGDESVLVITQATDEDEDENYSDIALLTGPAKWVAFGTSYAKA